MKTLDDYVAIDLVYRQKYKWIDLAKEFLKGAKFYRDVIDVLDEEHIEIEGKCYPFNQFNADRQYSLRLIKENINHCYRKITEFYLS